MAATFEEKLASAVENLPVLLPPELKKLVFMFRIMIMLMILMPLVGTKLYAYVMLMR